MPSPAPPGLHRHLGLPYSGGSGAPFFLQFRRVSTLPPPPRTKVLELAAAGHTTHQKPRMSPRDVARLLAGAAAVVAAIVAAATHSALAASGGVMGGRSSSSSSSPSLSSSSSYSSSSQRSSSSSWRRPSPRSQTQTEEEKEEEGASPRSQTRTEGGKEKEKDGGDDASAKFLGYLALTCICAFSLYHGVRHITRRRTTVVKFQVALLGLARSCRNDLNQISSKVDTSNDGFYKFMLTETLCSLRRHKDFCVASSISADVKDRDMDSTLFPESWEEHFDQISMEERSKVDVETLYNIKGIKIQRRFQGDPEDAFRNNYIVLTVLLAAKGKLKYPKIRNIEDLLVVLEKLNSIHERKLQGVQVLWTPQDEDDFLSEERVLQDYPYLNSLWGKAEMTLKEQINIILCGEGKRRLVAPPAVKAISSGYKPLLPESSPSPKEQEKD